MANRDLFDSKILYDRDYEYNYFGFKTLERSYLMKIDGKVVERPQEMNFQKQKKWIKKLEKEKI